MTTLNLSELSNNSKLVLIFIEAGFNTFDKICGKFKSLSLLDENTLNVTLENLIYMDLLILKNGVYSKTEFCDIYLNNTLNIKK